ncbi:TIR domain-containing protein [Agromyces mediolanus]|uniref:TIR domain-containing protein n=1 Tax=Agromyces mediolanus TaxID=41986 RepID=UPI001E347652|nr:TIR domain-containing protein [Agromyces mediolanus]
MRKVFYSFHYKRDSQRVSQVKNMGVVEGQPILSANKWEEVEGGGEAAIKEWIATEMSGKSCLVVLIGAQTAGRKWVNYEIIKAWNDRKGVLGIHIHNLKNLNGDQDTKGGNPFGGISVGDKSLSSIVKTYDPPYSTSTYVYSHIKDNLEAWVEDAIAIRARY